MALEPTERAFITLIWRDDDKPDVSNERRIDCGMVGETGCFRSERRMGVYRGRQYTIRISDPRPIIIVGAEEELEVLGW